MKCLTCGAPVSAGQKICEHCGSPIVQATKGEKGGVQEYKEFPKEKELKRSTEMFKSITEAGKSGASEALTGMMGLLGPAAIAFKLMGAILKPLEPILKIVGQFFNIIGGEIMKSLMPVLNPLIKLLIGLTPVIQLVGMAFGWLIRIALIPLASAVYGIGVFIASLIDLFTFGIFGAVGNWNAMMLPILGGLIAPSEFAEGGTVPGAMGSPTLIKAHGGETVHREGYDAEMLGELRSINAYNRWNYQRKRRQW